MSQSAPNGEPVEVPTVVQLLAPAGERWKTTCAIEPASAAFACSATVARRFVPGFARLTVGAVLSTATVRVPLVKLLPAASVVTVRRS